MKNKKWLALALVLILVVGSLTGCSGSGGNSSPKESSTPAAETSKATSSAESSKAEPVAPSGEKKELSVLTWDLGAEGQAPLGDNYWCSWMQEEFGDPNNIKLSWVSMPRWEEVQTLNVWMAGKEAPDIVYTYDINVCQNYIAQGGLTDLTDYVAEYGPNLKAFIGEETLDYGVFDGKQMLIPSPRPFAGIVGTSIRGDWLDKLGLKVPTTTEEFHNVMLAFKEQDPGNLGELNIPWGMGMQEISFGYFNVLYSFVDPNLTEEQLTCTYPFEYPGYKEGVRFINQCYNEGLISPEFALDTDCSKMVSDITNGYVGFFSQNLLTGYATGSFFETLAQNVDGAYFVACDTFANSAGKHVKLRNQPYGKFIMVPIFSEAAKEAVMYMDWLLTDNHIMRLGVGDEGKHYTVNDDGTFVFNSDYDGEDKIGPYNNYEYRFIVEDIWYGSIDAVMKNKTSKCIDKEQADIAVEMGMTDTRQDPWFFPYFKQPIKSEAQYSSTMIDKYKEIFTRTFMCTPEEFDSLYDQLVAEFMSLYGNEVCAERTEVWKATH